MKINKLHIKNFKSIADLEIIEPNPFTVFVGPNGSGKSNIFEALEFFISTSYIDGLTNRARLFGGKESISNRFNNEKESSIVIESDKFKFEKITSFYTKSPYLFSLNDGDDFDILSIEGKYSIQTDYYAKNDFESSYKRLFIKNLEKQKINFSDDLSLSFSGNNLEKVLKRILKDEFKKEEIGEWLDVFIPGYDKVEIESNELSGTDTLLMYEKGIDKPFTKELISDGSYNILCLLTVVLQSDEPQFLCIEEPENGLTPYVIREMVTFFRNACEEKGHYIWLNTHSQSLVSELSGNEIITVNKIGRAHV